MFARKNLLTAVTAVVIGMGATSVQAQFDDTPYNGIEPKPSTPQRGGTLKPVDPRPYPGAPVRDYNTNPRTEEGMKTAEYQAQQRELSRQENRINRSFPQYDTNRGAASDNAVMATERVQPSQPTVTQSAQVPVAPVTRSDMNGVDSRFIKPADPAVVNPDVRSNGGVDRVLAEDMALRGQQRYIGPVTNEPVVRDVSNHPIDSLNDPAFRNPQIPAEQFARPAAAREGPAMVVPPTNSTVVAPSTQPSSGSLNSSTGNTMDRSSGGSNLRSDEYKSTWSSGADRKVNDPAVRDNPNSPEVDKARPAPSKGERAPNALDNTRNPTPDTTTPRQ